MPIKYTHVKTIYRNPLKTAIRKYVSDQNHITRTSRGPKTSHVALYKKYSLL